MGKEQQPQTGHSDSTVQDDTQTLPADGTAAIVPDGATRFRRYCLGFFYLMSGSALAWITIMNTVAVNGKFLDYQAAGTPVPAGWIATVVAVIVGFAVVSLAGLFVGIWNLLSLKTMIPSPLIAGIFFSAASVVMLMLFFDDSSKFAWAFIHALVIFMTIRMLRQEGLRSLRTVRRHKYPEKAQ